MTILNESSVEEKPPIQKTKTVSFSQMGTWNRCRWSWALQYRLKKPKQSGPDLIAGTALHLAIQTWFIQLFEDEEKAKELDVSEIIKNSLITENEKSGYLTEEGKTVYPFTVETIKEYYSDLTAIMGFVMTHYPSILNPKEYELVDIERELRVSLQDNVQFLGFIDLVFRHKASGKIVIYDIKMSKKGWQIRYIDKSKTDQLVLYKTFYSNLFNVPFDDIDVKFLVLKRKVKTRGTLKESRASIIPITVKPEHVERVRNDMNSFIQEAITTEKEPTPENFPANPTNFNCTYCSVREHCNLKIT